MPCIGQTDAGEFVIINTYERWTRAAVLMTRTRRLVTALAIAAVITPSACGGDGQDGGRGRQCMQDVLTGQWVWHYYHPDQDPNDGVDSSGWLPGSEFCK